MRLRPVLMTSIAFIMGVVPLVFSTGAGAEIRSAMGVAVFSGMLGVTVFGLFLTPVFYSVIGRLAGRRLTRHAVIRRPPRLTREVTDGSHRCSSVAVGRCRWRRARRCRPYHAPQVAPAAIVNADPQLVSTISRSICGGGASSRILCSTR